MTCRCEQNYSVDLPFEAYELHFADGIFVPVYPVLPTGVEIEVKAGANIRVHKNTHLTKPIIIVCHGSNNLTNQVVVGGGARAELMEYCVDGKTKITNHIEIHQNGELHHCKSTPNAKVVNLVSVKDGGIYNACSLLTGAGENDTKVELLAEQAKATVDMAYLLSGKNKAKITTLIKHLSPLTFSNQLVKGVVNDEAKSDFAGKIQIAPLALETEGYLLHNAMILSDDAEVKVRPELEIFADNVKCSHGAASGGPDKEQLFYMRSRGIAEDDAKQILIDAYLDEVINKIENLEVREWMKCMMYMK